MRQSEYDQQKRECWEEFRAFDRKSPYSLREVNAFAFDKGYALGKQTETITQEEIEKASKEFAKSIIDSFGRNGVPCGISDILSMIADGFKSGASFSLGKQEKDANTVIQGWVARDADGEIYLYENKPERGSTEWLGRLSSEFDLQRVTWSDDPIEVEIQIKIKKNG